MSAMIVFVLRLLLAASLYGFLGWAIYTVWRELRLNNELISAQRTPSISILLNGAEPEEARIFNKPEVTIGRDGSCDYSIVNETVSARHARLSYHHKQWWLEDLKSTNGTFLNDERVSIATVVISGDDLRCGKVNLSVTIQS